ncbi:amidohydrolase [Biformimicrobium ophioploci]|uniref:Amidohydrolase n=1 Tax=Biformimicrobium ophioploci TaxID=3036711 RepID=A0ABQ6M1X3_9GAMM|nr:amidohydrolase [Microbulbifer sp. NKW57]
MLLHNIAGYHVSDKELLEFTAIAYDEGVVQATDSLTELKKRFPQAKLLDGGGRTLIPGLIDAHGHMLGLGRLQQQLELRDLGLDQTLAAIRARSAELQPGQWLLGRGWNQVVWPGKEFPTRQQLDALEIDNPVWLSRIDGHAGWANSQALELAGITRDTRSPEGGEIILDEQGEPTGVLIDNAMNLMANAIPAPTLADDKASLEAAFRIALSLGLTGVHDAGVARQGLKAYRELAAENRIPLRMYPMVAIESKDIEALLSEGWIGQADERLFVRSIKLSADGALGSRGAALIEPYHDRPDERGLLLHPEKEMLDLLRLATDKAFQVNVHAIGDRANHIVLNHLETLHKSKDQKPFRHRVEHAQVLKPADIPRFPRLDLIASMQPTHATSDMNMAADRVGEQRLEGAYAWRKFLEQGTRIAGGSDFPVEPVNPLYGIHAAVTRQNRANQPNGGWRMKDAMTREEALRAFTLDAAYASHQESVIGNLMPGKYADFVLLDRDIFKVPAEQIWEARVLETWVEGERVYQAQD